MPYDNFLPYLFVMALVTYLVRVIPLTLFKKKITSRFLNSFLYYVPYAVLAAMTFPAILYATSSMLSATIGLVIAVFLAFFGKSLITVAAGTCASVFLAELIMKMI